MSNNRKANPTVTTDDTSAPEEVLEGTITDIETPNLMGRVKNFTTKYKTWFIASGAAIGGFVLHGLLSEGESTQCELESDDSDDLYIDVTPEEE